MDRLPKLPPNKTPMLNKEYDNYILNTIEDLFMGGPTEPQRNTMASLPPPPQQQQEMAKHKRQLTDRSQPTAGPSSSARNPTADSFASNL